eukprot:TRINITY_DN8412_c0_g1_i1.p1 TRINITY_DN8412_c0_g1~~TRINITY_DN8412_c0_g1_i1.p1  ORF type:complete len:360 (+),score=107.83 TRINITY_DN8412_c0_g1_i1:125-1204(+)
MDKKQPNMMTEMTIKAVNNLKNNAPPLLNEFVKAAERYQKASQDLAKLGIQLADAVYRIGAIASGDMGEGIRKLAEYIKDTENKREELTRSMTLDLVDPLRHSVVTEQREAMNFEKNYKRDRDQVRADIVKLEQKTKKAGKKTTPQVLQQQISELNDKIKESETMRSSKLREVVLLDRRRWGTFLQMWNRVLAKETEFHSDTVTRAKANEPPLEALSAGLANLPKEFEEMISKQQRTFVQIQVAPDASSGNYRLSYAPGSAQAAAAAAQNYDSYDSYYGAYDSYDSGSTSSYESNSYAGGGGASARALYDYRSDEPSDLPLTAGDILTVLQQDDGSGWTKGQNARGQQGIFPTSYIEYI